jgi:hypothetical protein
MLDIVRYICLVDVTSHLLMLPLGLLFIHFFWAMRCELALDGSLLLIFGFNTNTYLRIPLTLSKYKTLNFVSRS